MVDRRVMCLIKVIYSEFPYWEKECIVGWIKYYIIHVVDTIHSQFSFQDKSCHVIAELYFGEINTDRCIRINVLTYTDLHMNCKLKKFIMII